MWRTRNERGLSLVEVTIVIMALTVLTSVLAPSVEDFVSSARDVKVKEDCEAIGLSLARLSRDIGPCMRMNGLLPCSIENRADLLISAGREVEGYAGVAGEWYGATETVASSGAAGSITAYTSRAGSVSTREVTEYVVREAAATTRWTDATHLGGSTAFFETLRSAGDLKRMTAAAGLADDIRGVLQESGLAGFADATIQALSSAAPAAGAPVPSCAALSPEIGQVVECEFGPGSTMEWMAYRPGAAKGNRAPARLLNVRWSGKAPFRAYLFRLANEREVYTFVVPFPCANLALMSIADIRKRTITTETAPTVTAETRYSSSWRETVRTHARGYANMNAAIGWFSTPIGAGLRYPHPNVDYLENHLIWNRPSGSAAYGYRNLAQGDFIYPGPHFNLGWRGAYLSSPINGDPWGHRYFVNTMFLFALGDTPGTEGYWGWHSNTFCLSAGANGIIETPFASYDRDGRRGNTVRGGDDFVYVMAGGSR